MTRARNVADIIKQPFTTTLGTSNYRAGVNAGNSIASGGNFNVCLGDEAGTALTTGDTNVAVGFEALKTEDTGGANVAVGYRALLTLNNDSGSTYNTAVGANAGSAVTTGIANTAIGALALDAATINNRNTAVGWSALTAFNNTSTATSDNTAIGAAAGLSLTTGTLNTLIGTLAGQNVTTGSNNCLVGYSVETPAVDTAQVIGLGMSITTQAANNFTFGFGSTDSNIAFGATSISAPSDERYKEDIADSTAGLSFIKDLRPVTFKWKKEKDVPSDHKAYVADSDDRVMQSQGETNHGFIAQEVKTAIDNHSEIKDGFDMWSADPTDGRQRLGAGALVPILVKAIQEQNALIEALTARVATLEG